MAGNLSINTKCVNIEIVEHADGVLKERSDADTKDLRLSEILDLCKYDVIKKKHYLGEIESYARFEWAKVVSYVNFSYGMSCTIKELKSEIRNGGEQARRCY